MAPDPKQIFKFHDSIATYIVSVKKNRMDEFSS